MRAADEKKCASGTWAEQEAEKAARDSHHNNAIDLTNDMDFEVFHFGDEIVIVDEGPSSRPGTSQPPPDVNLSTKPQPPPINNLSKPSAASSWTCPTCTLINEPLAQQCDACLTARPPHVLAQAPASTAPAGWTCGVCGEQGMEHNLWTCRFCGSVKTQSIFG
jgi:DNA-dependent metalloprotease WSS1